VSEQRKNRQIDLFAQSAWIADNRLFVNVAELTDNTKVQKLLSRLGIKYVGQAVAQEKAKLIQAPGYGRRTVAKLEAALQRLDLKLDASLPDWGDLSTEEIEAAFADEIQQAAAWMAERKRTSSLVHLEDEFHLLLSQVPSGRNRDMIARRYGMNGSDPATLQSIADDFGGLTRERVRQITDRFSKTIRKKAWSLPMLDRAIEVITKLVPSSEAGIVGVLQSQSICRGIPSISAVVNRAGFAGGSNP